VKYVTKACAETKFMNPGIVNHEIYEHHPTVTLRYKNTACSARFSGSGPNSRQNYFYSITVTLSYSQSTELVTGKYSRIKSTGSLLPAIQDTLIKSNSFIVAGQSHFPQISKSAFNGIEKAEFTVSLLALLSNRLFFFQHIFMLIAEKYPKSNYMN
jgi:hypothetical protein